ncbi:MAG: hypothetical protein HMLIMOIP_002056 [Candidatus Nitrosomirales archaeon]|jgi:hypothetical protein
MTFTNDDRAIYDKATNQCHSCLAYRNDDKPVIHKAYCERETHRVYDYIERADLFLRQENAGITDYWYEE